MAIQVDKTLPISVSVDLRPLVQHVVEILVLIRDILRLVSCSNVEQLLWLQAIAVIKFLLEIPLLDFNTRSRLIEPRSCIQVFEIPDCSDFGWDPASAAPARA